MGNPPTDDAVTALKIHNDARAGKNLTALVWDDNLSHQATEYAKQLTSINTLRHSDGAERPDQGENLYMEFGLTNPASAAAQSWIDESANYHGENIGDGDFGSYGHYTQCMWSSTTNMGMGYATASNGSVFLVGRYSPPGNFTGSKPF